MSDTSARLNTALQGLYRIERKLGEGGMAVVYLADDFRHGRRVAIKVLRPDLFGSTDGERFEREIRIAARLSHPHIVPLYDSGSAAGHLYYVMPYVDGETLRDRLARTGPLDVAFALRIAHDLGEALDFAHRHGVVHRDIKPANILLTDGHAQVMDFGVARALEMAAAEPLTASGASPGTPAYMSPEQASGQHHVDGRADIYSLGCVLYESLTGKLPFEAKSVRGQLAGHLVGEVPSAASGRHDVPEALSLAIARAMAKEPGGRFATASDFVAALNGSKVPGAGLPATRHVHKRRIAQLALAGVLLMAIGLGLRAMGRLGPSFTGRPASIVVLPVGSPTSSEAERATAGDLAGDISIELNRWESIYAVPRVALAGPMFDLGLKSPTVDRVESGVLLARELGVEALLALYVDVRGDSVRVEAQLYDVATAGMVGRPFEARAAVGENNAVKDAIAARVLGIDAPAFLGRLRDQSSNPDALAQDAEGQRHLEHWRLDEAAQRFRTAIELDSTFAMAHLRLAQTMYWMNAQNGRRLNEAGPQIRRESATAVRHSGGLPAQDSLHIRAFFSFQEGDYGTARSLYTSLLDQNGADVYAWLMLGSTEYRDLELSFEGEGLLPRSNLNAAIHSFRETLRLQPTFDLGYGHLFDIHWRIARAAHDGICPAFHEPGADALPAWELTTPERLQSFCPVVTDSVEWMDWEAFGQADREVYADRANELFARSVHLLDRWVEYAPGATKPLEELARVLTRQLSTLGPTAPERIDSLTERARVAASKALTLRGDTLPEEAFRLANLHLAAGQVRQALTLADRVRMAAGRERAFEDLPPNAANVYLAAGRPADALRVISTPRVNWYLEDDQTGQLFPYGGGEASVLRALVMAGSGEIRTELDALERAWSGPGFTEHRRDLLRNDATLRMAPALAMDGRSRVEWQPRVGLEHPLWMGLITTPLNPQAARELIDAAMDEEAPGLSEAGRTFTAAIIATRAGLLAEAAQLLTRMDSLPAAIDSFDSTWGLRAHALLLRAQALEELGQPDQAAEEYRRVLDQWVAPDSLVAPLLEEARGRLARLRQ